MGCHNRICVGVCCACVWVLCFASLRALGACPCAGYAFQRANDGYASYYTSLDAAGAVLHRNSIFGNGQVYCDDGSCGVNCLTYPLYVWHHNGSTYVLQYVITASQAGSCWTNGVSGIVYYTNYTHCITWTNNTGVGKAFTFFQDPTGCAEGTYVREAEIIGYIGAGGVISRCWTNKCAGDIGIYVSPYNGAPRDEWVAPEDQRFIRGTNVVQEVPPADGVTPGNGLGGVGGGLNPGGANGVQATNVAFGTNQVRVWNVAPTNGISGSGATSQDIYALGDALIRAGQLDADRIIAAIRQGATNGVAGGDGASNAVRRFHMDATNQLAGLQDLAAGLLTQAGSNGLAYRNATNLHALLRGDGLTTNSYGDVSGVVGAAGSVFSDNYGDFTNVSAGLFSGTMTNGISGNESALHVSFAEAGDYPGAYLAGFDLRPSQWNPSLIAAGYAVRSVVALLCVCLLYWFIWGDFEIRFGRLQLASQHVGRALSSASVIGSTAGLGIKTVIASLVSVGLAGLPTLVFGFLDSIGVGGSITDSFVEVAYGAANAVSPTLGSAITAVWVWFGALVPFGTIVGSIVNYWLWRVLAFGFEALWHIVFRLLPVVVFGFVVSQTASGADWIIDNRLSQPVGVIGGDVNGLQTQWFSPGEHRAPGLLSSFTIAYGLTPTNGMTVNATGDEWTRLVVGETTTNSWVAYVYTEGEHGFRWGFTRGFGFGCVSLVTVGVLWFGRRTLRMAFGGQSE